MTPPRGVLVAPVEGVQSQRAAVVAPLQQGRAAQVRQEPMERQQMEGAASAIRVRAAAAELLLCWVSLLLWTTFKLIKLS